MGSRCVKAWLTAWLTATLAEPPLPATPLEGRTLLNAAPMEEAGRIDVAAGRLPPRTVPGLVLVASLTPSAIRRRA